MKTLGYYLLIEFQWVKQLTKSFNVSDGYTMASNQKEEQKTLLEVMPLILQDIDVCRTPDRVISLLTSYKWNVLPRPLPSPHRYYRL